MVFRRIVFKHTFGVGELVDYNFSNGSYTYLGELCTTTFTQMTIYNGTTSDIYYNIERDPNNVLTVNAADNQGTMLISRGATIEEDTQEIIRLRIRSTNSGIVYVALYFTQRN